MNFNYNTVIKKSCCNIGRIVALSFFMMIMFIMTDIGYGSSIGVSPVRLDMPYGKNSAVMNVKNDGANPVIIEIETYLWEMNDEKTSYSPAGRELIVNPPVFKLEPGHSQIVRIGLFSQPPSEKEKCYRIYLQEVLPKTHEQAGVQTILRIGVPLFVKPAVSTQSKLAWKVVQSASGTILETSNSGGEHVRISSLYLRDSVKSKPVFQSTDGGYILAGAAYKWKLPATLRLEQRMLFLNAVTDHGEIDAILPGE